MALFFLSGCINSNNIPLVANPTNELATIQSVYAKELANIKVGDYIKDVQAKFPEMVMTSDNMKNTIYELNYHQKYYLLADSKANQHSKTYTQKLAFYFINKKLVQWQAKKI